MSSLAQHLWPTVRLFLTARPPIQWHPRFLLYKSPSRYFYSQVYFRNKNDWRHREEKWSRDEASISYKTPEWAQKRLSVLSLWPRWSAVVPTCLHWGTTTSSPLFRAGLQLCSHLQNSLCYNLNSLKPQNTHSASSWEPLSVGFKKKKVSF